MGGATRRVCAMELAGEDLSPPQRGGNCTPDQCMITMNTRGMNYALPEQGA